MQAVRPGSNADEGRFVKTIMSARPAPPAKSKTPAAQLAEFMGRFAPNVSRRARGVLAKMRARLRGAVELVYDNYNGLVIGFGPSDRASEAPFSIVLYPRWVTLFFLRGAHLSDPDGILKGSGTRVRRVNLESPEALDDPSIRALIQEALVQAQWYPTGHRSRRLVIKAVMAKQRPRRPDAAGLGSMR